MWLATSVTWYLKEHEGHCLLWPQFLTPQTLGLTGGEVTWQHLSLQLAKGNRHQGFLEVNLTQQPSSEDQPTLKIQGEFLYSPKFQSYKNYKLTHP